MEKITGIYHNTGEMNGKPWENYEVTTRKEGGIGENARVIKLSKEALKLTLTMAELKKEEELINRYIDEKTLSKYMNKYKQLLYIVLYKDFDK